MSNLPPEIAGHLRGVFFCPKCKRKRGFAMQPNRNAAGRVEFHIWRCGVCGEPLQNSIRLTDSEVQELLAKGEAIKRAHAAKQAESES